LDGSKVRAAKVSTKNVTNALEEVAENKITFQRTKNGIK
jgi:DNA-directed RNA polymerase subunit K/omega